MSIRVQKATAEESAFLRSRGVESGRWIDYVVEKADEYDVPRGTAANLFNLFGPSEAFDGFISAIQDLSEEDCYT